MINWECFNKDQLIEKLFEIEQWCNAYPIKIFRELTDEDFKKIHKVLKESDYTLDRIAASNFRYVLGGIKNIIKKEQKCQKKS